MSPSPPRLALLALASTCLASRSFAQEAPRRLGAPKGASAELSAGLELGGSIASTDGATYYSGLARADFQLVLERQLEMEASMGLVFFDRPNEVLSATNPPATSREGAVGAAGLSFVIRDVIEFGLIRARWGLGFSAVPSGPVNDQSHVMDLVAAGYRAASDSIGAWNPWLYLPETATAIAPLTLEGRVGDWSTVADMALGLGLNEDAPRILGQFALQGSVSLGQVEVGGRAQVVSGFGTRDDALLSLVPFVTLSEGSTLWRVSATIDANPGVLDGTQSFSLSLGARWST